ncbi:polyamine-modulated factor 1-binding protein 1 isoform 2-T2 [Pluvialis apricaria]
MQHPLTQLPSLQLRAQEEQSQGLRHSLARLQEELGATCIQKQQSLQQLSEAKETIQDLHQEVACNRKHLAELLQQVQDMATLQAELAQAKQEKAKQEEKIGAYEEQRKQLQWELRKLQGAQEQSKQEAHSLQEKLQELSSQAQHWQQLHQDSEQALAVREEELVVCKVELAFLKEELRKAKEQVQDRNRQHRSPRAGAQAGPLAPGNDRSWPTGRAEVERTGQGTVYCRSQATKGSGSSRAEYLVLLKLALFAPLLERSPSAWNYRVVTEVHGQ